MNIVDFAHQILDLEADRNHWQREAMHFKELYEMHSQMTTDSIAHSEELIGTVLLAALDPDSGLNRAHRALARDPLQGAAQ